MFFPFFINKFLFIDLGPTDRIFDDAPLKPFRSLAGQWSGITVLVIRTRFYWKTLKRVTPTNFVSSVRTPLKIGSICWRWPLKRQLRVQTTQRISCHLNDPSSVHLTAAYSCRTEEYRKYFYAQFGVDWFSFISRPFSYQTLTPRLGRWSSRNHKMILNAG